MTSRRRWRRDPWLVLRVWPHPRRPGRRKSAVKRVTCHGQADRAARALADRRGGRVAVATPDRRTVAVYSSLGGPVGRAGGGFDA